MSGRNSSSLCGTEVCAGTVPHSDSAKVGYLSIKPPLSLTYEHSPQTYKSGLNPKGKIVGRNVTIPYPGEMPKYHDIRFLRNVDWAGGSCSTRTDQVWKRVPVGTCTGNTAKDTAGAATEIDEYFTAGNDEGYRKWAEKKSQTCESEGKDPERTSINDENIRECMKDANKTTIDQNLSTTASHHMPVRFQTTNQTYGSYIDLTKNYPTKRKLRPTKPGTVLPVNLQSIERLNHEKVKMSALFGLNLHPKSDKTTNMVYYNHPRSFDLLGKRDKCQTFPVYGPTGLEMNRIPATDRSIFCTMAHEQLLTRPSRMHLGKVRPSHTLRVSIPYLPTYPRTRSPGGPAYISVQSKRSIL